MPVVINDFEIVLDPPAERGAPAAAGSEAPPERPMRPEDVLEITRHAAGRRARLRAD